ncbi:collagen alpha-6(VI) chain-like isoform X2 [Hyla sarda]|uniref:collagen alpha-6(VI) chain-like isoform X2 n=1 Tax=Hyla sarda TaxID=327740 RepID=UPI0024C2C90F|nr:collagen alpha-6(VI) chain-like isoform X2 [Hyla sarda]
MRFLFGLFLMASWLELSSSQDTVPEYADLVFLVDNSNNMGKNVFNQVKTFISRTVSQMQIGVNQYRIALAHYNDDLNVDFSLSTFKAKNPIINYIKNKFDFGGGSLMTGNALGKIKESLFNEINLRDKSKYPPVLVVITSGPSLDDVQLSADALKQESVRIITMGLKNASKNQLEAMATSPTLAFMINNVRELTTFSKDMVTTIQDVVKNNYYLPSTQGTVVFTTASSPTAVVNNITAVCHKGIATDLVLMVDISEHTSSESDDMKKFLTNILSNLEISEYCVHVGLVAFNSKATLIGSLNQGISKSVVMAFIAEMKVSREKTANIGGAINYTRSEVFDDTLASRKNQGIQQLAILVTHKSSADSVIEAGHLLRQENVRLFSVGISQANETQMNYIVSHPTHLYQIRVKTFSDLSNKADILVKKILNVVDQDISSPEQTDLIRQGCLNTDVADIHLLIDGSGSISYTDFIAMKTFLVELIDMFDIGPQKVRVGAVQYFHGSQLEFGIATHYSKTNLKLAIQNIRQQGGGTNTGAAINYTREIILDPSNVRRGNVPVYFIVLTDGESQDSVKEAAAILRASKVNIYAIGVKEANQTQLMEIAGDPKRVHFVYDFDSLKDIKNVIAQQICSTKACQNVEADIMFLVDSSGSIGGDNFQKMKEFMKNLVNKTEVGPDKVQFGIVQFSDDSMEVLQLNKNGTKAVIWEAIDKMGYMEKGTYTGKALEYLSPYFTEKKGARPKVNKFLILITDGQSQDDVKLQSESLRNSGVNIISVGIFNANKTQLLEISGKIERVHYLETFDTLKSIEDELVFGICNPPEECARIEVADIVFIMDSSGSISDEQYVTMKNFIISFVDKSIVGPNNVQFGALKYSDDPHRLFYLNEHDNKQEIIKFIQDDRSIGGNTYTAEALEFSKRFFTEKQGSRQRRGVPQYLIVITDGESHDQDQLPEVSKHLQDAGIVIYAIGVDKAKTKELKTMAGTKGKWYFVDNFDGLNDIFKNISDAACKRTECQQEQADITFLIDGSGSIVVPDFIKMKKFMVSVIEDFDIGPNKVHVGVAQYSDTFRTEFQLKTFLDKETLKKKVNDIVKLNGNTYIGNALRLTDSALLSPAANSRISEGVQQILLVITDGISSDSVAQPAEALRSKGVYTYAVGVGKVSETQLLQIAGSSSSRFSVDNFDELKNIKKRIVRDICEPKTSNNCSVDVVVGFDVSSYINYTKLFSGQDHLEAHITDILNSMMNLRSPTCNPGVTPQISVAFYVPNANTSISPLFHTYSPDLAQRLKDTNVNGPSFVRSDVLQSMWNMFQNSVTGRAKMMLVFTDGLDENVEDLEQTVENLRKQGLTALVTIALEGATGYDDIKHIEFGRGFEYSYQMHIGMPDIGVRLARQASHVNEKTCCCVFCKCFGQSGAPGIHGQSGKKGLPGQKGHPGHAGEQGADGNRGLPGAMGEHGDKGCEGVKGPKGSRGLPGDQNGDGEQGIDGIHGEEGKSGPPGMKGEKGEIGELGKSGLKGTKGPKGLKSQKGDLGTPGNDSTITGPPGLKGEPGMQGEPGIEGESGEPGANGPDSLPGRRGVIGPQGTTGDPGMPGLNGEQGLRGPQGDEGTPGIKGENGRNGPVGLQGLFGIQGNEGHPGNPGQKGKKGEPGDRGEKGDLGQKGLRGLEGDNGRDSYGASGKQGHKGQQGRQGDIGVKGEQGNPGIEGDPGPKGQKGNIMFAEQGEIGDPGSPGQQGRRGPKGMSSQTDRSPCELIDYIRKTCRPTPCPVYPTEMVFALDMSKDVKPETYNKMIEIVTYILNNITIRGTNCPVGARVAVMSYNQYPRYLVRFSDFQSKEKLLNAVKNIPLESSTDGRNIGKSMSFVARNVFKRSLQGATVRKIAVFFSNGRTDDPASISTATMEYNALGIIPAVITFTAAPALKRAFSIDDSGTFRLVEISANGEYKLQLQTLMKCTLCYDTCKPDVFCAESNSALKKSPMDVGFLLDSSYHMKLDEFEAARNFISTLIDGLDITNTGARVAVVSSAPPGFRPENNGEPYLEFDFSTYSSPELMKKHLKENTHRLRDAPAFGLSLKWMLENIMSKTSDLKNNKAIIMILSGETSHWDKQTLREASFQAKCQGFALFVLFIGKTYNNTELIELASSPTEHHLLQLGQGSKPNFGYATRFTRAFLNSVKLGINKYPPPELKAGCPSVNGNRKKRLTLSKDKTKTKLLSPKISNGNPKRTKLLKD